MQPAPAPGPHPSRPSARSDRVAVALLVFGLAGAAAVLFLFDPNQSGFYPLCMFHRTTGLLCPGCGSLRALHQLLHGEVASAFRHNALLVCGVALGLALGFRYLLGQLRGRPAALGFRPGLLWAGLVLLILFGIARNLPFAQNAWLAP